MAIAFQVIVTVFVMGFPLWTLLILAFIKRQDIMAFLHPDWYYDIEMVCLDESIIGWLERKQPEKLTMEYGGMDYNLFHLDNEGRRNAPVYRSERLAKFIFLEGNKNPLDLRGEKKSFSSDSIVQKEMSKIQLAQLVSSVSGGFGDFIEKYKWFILAGLIILVLILVFRKPTVVIDQSLINETVQQALKKGG